MRKKSLLLTLAGGLLGLSAWAQPFQTTTVGTDGFAAGTSWYTMRIGNSQKYLTDNGTASSMTLKASSQYEDADLWCFTGNDANGYAIYNKQAGAGKVLASATTMNTKPGYNGTGGTTYPTLQAANALPAGYVGTWDLATSNKVADVDGYFVKIHGTSYAMNDFGGLGTLAFWAEGMDAGSTISFELVETSTEINEANGTFTTSNPAKTWHGVWESNVVSGLTLSTGVNNMTTEGGYISGASGTSHTSTYTITAPEGFIITGYSFDFVNHASITGIETLTINGQSYTSSSTPQHVDVTGLKERTASFVQTGNNKCVTLKNFIVVLRKDIAEPEPQQNLYITNPGAKPYRIPAIATAPNGHIFAISDYRPCGSDIGYGEVDIKCRISKDNGQTWGDEFFLANGEGDNASENWKIGFGDAAVVADCERNELLVMSVCGKVVCWNGNYIPDSPSSNPNPVARTRATYNESTGEWDFTEPENVTESIYRLFVNENNEATVKSLFIGSGKIAQSRIIKVDNYYRLYCAVWTKNEGNRVIYSDDFGDTWHVLGSINDRPATGGDEPKCEELPDGSVLLSSRVGGGRIFNIYTFTNRATGEGYWSSAVTSNTSTNGIAIGGNSTNGEVMVVPAKRKEDNAQVYILLQSVPFGSGRAQVGIYYKELESLSDFANPTAVASDWDGRHQSTALGSAYSTMTWQKNNTVGFLYEEETFGAGYTIVYKNYTIEQITDDAYEYDPTVEAGTIISRGIDAKAEGLEGGTMVGQVDGNAIADIQAAIDAYKSAPSQETYDAINVALANLPQIEVVPNAIYRLRNVNRSSATLYLTPEASRFTAATTDLSDADQFFRFVPAEVEGTYYLQNCNYETYLGPLTNNETQPIVTTDPAQAGVWVIKGSLDGRSQVICQNNTGSYKGLHLAGDNVRLVPWTVDAEASLWYIEPVNTYDVTLPGTQVAAVCYPFAYTLPEGVTAYTISGLVEVNGEVCAKLEELPLDIVPAAAPLLLYGQPGAKSLTIVDEYATSPLADNSAAELKGVLAATTVADENVYLLDNFSFTAATSKAIATNTAYLTTETAYTALPLTLEEGVPVGIGSIMTNSHATRLYDLNGRRVLQPTHGIYVTGEGQKVLFR